MKGTSRIKLKLKDANTFTLEELSMLSPQTMHKVISQMSPEHKNELLAECEMRIREATERGTAVGMAWTDTRGISRFPSPYALAKKYSNLYTCIAGYQTDADLEARRQEKFEKTGLTGEQVKAMEAKGWKVTRKEVKK